MPNLDLLDRFEERVVARVTYVLNVAPIDAPIPMMAVQVC
jgi:hypothetical protein